MSRKRTKTTNSQEDYLEAILYLETEKGSIRISDLAKVIGVGKSAASLAIKTLKSKGLVNHNSYGRVTLTDEGRKIAEWTKMKHESIRAFLMQHLGLSYEVAEENACRMEHVVSADVIERLAGFVKFSIQCPLGTVQWVDGEGYVCRQKDSSNEPQQQSGK